MSELYIYPSEDDYNSDYSDNVNEYGHYEYNYKNKNETKNSESNSKLEQALESKLEINKSNYLNYDTTTYFNGKILLIDYGNFKMEPYMKYKSQAEYSLFIWLGDNKPDIERFLCIHNSKLEICVNNCVKFKECFYKSDCKAEIEIEWDFI